MVFGDDIPKHLRINTLSNFTLYPIDYGTIQLSHIIWIIQANLKLQLLTRPAVKFSFLALLHMFTLIFNETLVQLHMTDYLPYGIGIACIA